MSTSVRWPTFDLPHSQTLRACVYRYALGSKLWLIVVGSGVAAIAVYHIVMLSSLKPDQASPTDPESVGIAYFLWWAVLFAAVAIALPAVFILQHLTSVGRALVASASTKRWRDSWTEFEAASRAFDEKVPARIPPNSTHLFVELLRQAPRLPIRRRIELDQYDDQTIPTGIPNDGSQRFNANEPLLGFLVCLFSYWKVPQATGYANGVITHVQMLSATTQFWAFVSTVTSGPTLSVRVQSGVLWWTEPGLLTDGTNYRGDLACVRDRYAGGASALGLLGLLAMPFRVLLNPLRRDLVDLGRLSIRSLVFAVIDILIIVAFVGSCLAGLVFEALSAVGSGFRPLLLLVFTVPLAIGVLFRLLIDRKYTVGQLLSMWDLTDGDATDLIALSMERRKDGGFGVVPSENLKAALIDARQQTRRLCMKAVRQIEAKARTTPG